MTIKEYISESLPKKCGNNKAGGRMALLAYEEEQINPDLFPAEAFNSARERAALGMPYKPKNVKEYEKGLDVLEYVILKHRQKKHGEDNRARMTELLEKRVYDADEKAVMQADWWSA